MTTGGNLTVDMGAVKIDMPVGTTVDATCVVTVAMPPAWLSVPVEEDEDAELPSAEDVEDDTEESVDSGLAVDVVDGLADPVNCELLVVVSEEACPVSMTGIVTGMKTVAADGEVLGGAVAVTVTMETVIDGGMDVVKVVVDAGRLVVTVTVAVVVKGASLVFATRSPAWMKTVLIMLVVTTLVCVTVC